MAKYKVIWCPYCENPLVVNTKWKTRKCDGCGTRLRTNMQKSEPLDEPPAREYAGRGIEGRGLYRPIELMRK